MDHLYPRRRVYLSPRGGQRGRASIDLHPDIRTAGEQARRLRRLYWYYRHRGYDPQIARLATIGMFADRLIWEGI